MKNLAQHIEDLLLKHKCVIVPGLGGFLTYRDKAFMRNNIFYAPSERIRFNSLLTYHDGLLAESYMQERNISYSDALLAINEEVKLINSSLSNGNTFILGRIGALSISENNNIILHNSNSKFLPDNIGLPVVHLKQLPNSANNGNTIVLNIPQNTNTLRHIAMIAIIFLIAALAPTPINDQVNKASISFDSLRNIKSTTICEIPKIECQLQDTITTQPTPKLTNTDTQTTENRYHLIIASLTTQTDAEEYIANHKDFDNTQLQIIKCKEKYRISAKSFPSYKEAIKYTDSIRNENTFARKAWILCQ